MGPASSVTHPTGVISQAEKGAVQRTTKHFLDEEWVENYLFSSLRDLIACTDTALPFLWPKSTLSVPLAWKADTPWNIILNFKIIHITDSIMYMPAETSLLASVMKRPGQVSPGASNRGWDMEFGLTER
jgi:hypothetical protein